MKKAILLFAGLFFALTVTAQHNGNLVIGNGHNAKETRKVDDFTVLRANGPFEIRLIEGTTGAITLEGDSNLLELVSIDVTQGVLQIAPVTGSLFRTSKGSTILIKIPFNSLSEISLKGSGSVTSKRVIPGDITVNLLGSGNINLNVESTSIAANVSGSGSVILKGSAESFVCAIAGSGSVKAKEMQALNVDVKVSGSGGAQVFSTKIIKGRISGSGNVAYSGNPPSKDLKTVGSGAFKML